MESFDVWIHLFIFISNRDKVTSGCIVKWVKTVYKHSYLYARTYLHQNIHTVTYILAYTSGDFSVMITVSH